jgi:hypothetical protein
MITPLPPRFTHLADLGAFGRDRPRRVPNARRHTTVRRIPATVPNTPAIASVTRGPRYVRSTWATEHACFDLVLRAHVIGLQVRLWTWLRSGEALEECFLIHSLDEFEQWIAKAPTKFDHPVAHEEIRRFGHGILSR